MKQSRKEFIQHSSLGLLGMLLAPHLLQAANEGREATLVHASEGETYWIGMRNSPLTIKVAKDRQGHSLMSFCTEEIAPGEQVPVHKHLNEDELIFLHQGSGLLTLGEKQENVETGSVALVPKELWHGLKNTGTNTLIMAFAYSPAGFEGYFREMGSPAGTPWQPKTREEFAQLNKKWGIAYK